MAGSSVHSRQSSASSGGSISDTPTSYSRSHGTSSSSSTLASSSGSISVSAKAPLRLHDLLEEPAELEPTSGLPIEPLCICDTPFCEHRDSGLAPSAVPSNFAPEWSPRDDCFSDGELAVPWFTKRRKSGDATRIDPSSARLSNRWPSITRRWRERDSKQTASGSSTPLSTVSPFKFRKRPSSLRLPSLRQSFAQVRGSSEMRRTATILSEAPRDEEFDSSLFQDHLQSHEFVRPIEEVQPPHKTVDPIDRHTLSSTPLLPPLLAEPRKQSIEEVYSPLQSPSVASAPDTPELCSHFSSLPTPPLSAKPSVASIAAGRTAHQVDISSRVGPEEDDPWAAKLGHANFRITPAPYTPPIDDISAGGRLLDDWEAARSCYLRQVAPIREHYGPTSATYVMAEAKWAHLDARWRTNMEAFNCAVTAKGFAPLQRPLTPTPALPGIVSQIVTDPKFSEVPINDAGRAEIVGHMVRYKPVGNSSGIRTQKRKSARELLRIFTDPASLFAGTARR